MYELELWIIAFSPNLSIKSFVLFINCFIALKLYAAVGEGHTKNIKNKKKSARPHGIF